MKKFFLFLFFVSSLFAQVEYSRKGGGTGLLPKFYIDLATYASQDSEKSKIDVFIKIPYSNIQFLKTATSYAAKYSVTISLYDDDEVLKLEKLWTEKINVQNFQQTSSNTSFSISYKSFTVKPGEYKFVCKVEDLESKKHFPFEQEVKIRKFSQNIDLSDIILVSEYIESQEGTKIIPNISNLVTSQDTMLSFFYELYSNADTTLNIAYSISDKEKKLLYIKDNKIKVEKGKNEINETLENIKFALGDYQLNIKVIENDKMIKGIGKKFSSKIFGFPAIVTDLDEAIQQMQYIAASRDISEMEDIENYQDRLDAYINYWKRLDPSPNTVENETLNEYYRRVAYADESFGGYFKGWRSDMGMVYITLGPPDQVTRRPYEIDTRPYEIWDYYVINRSFIFVDQTNFGDYRLENPAYGDWFRYRP
ncbi:MAG: GWxTD domain-containing protein [Ignavibacteriales bacterium]|nr:GWxTD domain-containing protein [Ignavibacteriota bacterium]MCB9247994.1 GWxTD domain-containing protein [Ignavibacteriales bacterium]